MCLIVFLVQRQPLIMILLVAALIVLSFLSMLFSSRFKNYLKHVFTLYFIFLVGGGVFVSLSAFQMQGYVNISPQFFYGFHTCILGIFILKNTDNKVKLFFVCVTPPILLKMFQLYDLETLQFIEFAICGAVLLALMLYRLEYTERLCFSKKILNQKQMYNP
ncbi:hypothetical protein FGO68_gene9517 [Halteria grandinella]|uniref:Uncharacterized protein n=1 Tax=Halteria grandinella TaxID=5974 RepID=A0A8J8SX81_HALGN|nr:hypothetical protein FGO68_gene9517 [Halteria grandinella]